MCVWVCLIAQDSREELRTLYSDYHRMNSENEELNLLVCRDNEKVRGENRDLFGVKLEFSDTDVLWEASFTTL